MQPPKNAVQIVRVNAVHGFAERRNNILFVPKSSANNDIVVFFGGDTQDFSVNMKNNSKNKKYMRWSLENVATLLNNKFTESHVIVIQPSRFDRNTYSCYDNFVPSGDYGIPTFVVNHNAISHLQALLDNVCDHVKRNHKQIHDVVKDRTSYENFANSRIKLIGFSKGCVVLNQFIYEFNSLRSSNACQPDIISRIADMYFLDGGHAGRKNTWITAHKQLLTFSTLDINIHIHVTPYQVCDQRRPWIGNEEKLFTDTLIKFGAKINRKLHFEHESSLDKHFEILIVFS